MSPPKSLLQCTTQASYPDLVSYAQALMALRPDRMVWGSDWPYIRFIDKVAVAFNPRHFFMDAIQDSDHRQLLFSENAKILYQFE